MKYLALATLVGCGRLAFDPRTDDANSGGADAPATSGPVLHFAFDSGAFLKDSAGGHDATCSTCPTPTGSVARPFAAHFDGTACLTVVYDIQPTTFTYALWERTADMRQETLFGRPRNGATSMSNSVEVFGSNSSTSLFLIASPQIVEVQRPQGAWHHVAGAFDGSALTTYLDGAPYNMGPMQGAVPWASDPFLIGCDIDVGTELSHYVGDLDDVRFYDRALSAAEIAALAAL